MIARFETPELQETSTHSSFNGVRLSTRTMPARSAERGGDWCEAFELSDDVIGLSIGDVRGHGTESYQAMVQVRQSIRDAARRGLNPSRTLGEANRCMRTRDAQVHATAIFATMNTRRLTVTFANAGHPPPLMTGVGGPVYLSFHDSDLPLGVTAELVPALRVIRIPADTLLVFYTDGVTEHDCQPLTGEVQLSEAAAFAYKYTALPSASVIERQMFLTGSNRDDAAILTLRTPLEPSRARFEELSG
jgi:serine phosphatase RsbU (regulator of sigma subunit)